MDNIKNKCEYCLNCLNCDNSYSLPAGEKFNDGTIKDYDRLVCRWDDQPEIVPEDGFCSAHTRNNIR